MAYQVGVTRTSARSSSSILGLSTRALSRSSPNLPPPPPTARAEPHMEASGGKIEKFSDFPLCPSSSTYRLSVPWLRTVYPTAPCYRNRILVFFASCSCQTFNLFLTRTKGSHPGPGVVLRKTTLERGRENIQGMNDVLSGGERGPTPLVRLDGSLPWQLKRAVVHAFAVAGCSIQSLGPPFIDTEHGAKVIYVSYPVTSRDRDKLILTSIILIK